jgi:hypothetical protein
MFESTPVACPEIPASLKRSQEDWVASFLFLLELVGISLTIQIRKISEIREIREITAALSKKRAFLYIKREFLLHIRAFLIKNMSFVPYLN